MRFDCEKLRPPVFQLQRSTANELVPSSVFAALAVTNVAAAYGDRVYATDASLQKGAIVSRVVSPETAQVLWLGGDKKGCYTSLDPPFRAMRRAYEIELNEVETDPPLAAQVSVPESIDFVFDFVEICGGVGSVSKALAARGYTVMPPNELSDSPHFDVREIKLIEWLCDMMFEKRLLSIMVEPVCTTFSPAAHPSVRSYAEPKGYDMTDPKTKQGNIVAFRCLFLLWYASICGCPALGEQPRLSKMCWLSIWRFLIEHKDFAEAVVASCQFGFPHKKEFRMLGWGIDMQRMQTKCPGGHEHLRIEGQYTKPSAIYVPALAEHFAAFIHQALRVRAAREASEANVAGLESVLANDVLLTGEWKAEMSWRWRSPSHINVLESGAFVTLLRSLMQHGEDLRFTALLDSRVARGSHAKGRSSALALGPSLKKSAALQLSGGLYPSFGFAPTRLNVADAPTRDRDLPLPASHSFSDHVPFHRAQLLHATGFTRQLSGWIRLVLLMQYVSLSRADRLLDLAEDCICLDSWFDGFFRRVVSDWTFEPLASFPGSLGLWSLLGILSFSLLGFFLLTGFQPASCSPSVLPSPRVASGRASWLIGILFFISFLGVGAKSHGMQPLPLAFLFSGFALAMATGPENAEERIRALRRSSSVLFAERTVSSKREQDEKSCLMTLRLG